jgi:hypothetical protein
MTSHFPRRMLPIAAIGLIVAVVAVRPTTTAEVRSGAAAQAATPAVKTIPPGTRVASDPRTKGDTYYWLEGQTIRSTTRFGETVVVADRRGDGKLHAKVTDRSGNDHGDLVSSSSLVQYRAATGDMLQAQNESGEQATLEWASRQAYGLAKDGAANLVWDHGVMRAQRAVRRDTEGEADELETVWANGLVARLEKRDLPAQELAPGRTVSGKAWVTTLTKDGVVAGHSIWFEHDQVFAYQLAGLTDGLVWIGPEHLKADYGGWPFKPDLSWLNLQTIAAHHFKTLTAKQGFVAKRCETPQPSRLAQFFLPTVQANEAGCDRLHYFDATVLRDCCDDHDRCYSKIGCTERSWWQFWKSWSCDACNMVAVSCFLSGNFMDPCLFKYAWAC